MMRCLTLMLLSAVLSPAGAYWYALESDGTLLTGRIAPQFSSDELVSMGATTQVDGPHPSQLPGKITGPNGEKQLRWNGTTVVLKALGGRKVKRRKVAEAWLELNAMKVAKAADPSLSSSPQLEAVVNAQIAELQEKYDDLRARME